ncbi:MAG: hypothetical protein ACK57R_06920 [Dolichospermum sp.]|jgi:hypothetical protein|nr:hypothetical protein [Anabaena sp. 49628_E55]
MENLNDLLLPFIGNLHQHITLLANYSNIKDPDILEQMRLGWNHFVTTGQVWALFIGVVVGYLFKSLSSFG